MLVKESVVELVARPDRAKPISRGPSCHHHQLISVLILDTVRPALPVFVDIMEYCQLRRCRNGQLVLMNEWSDRCCGCGLPISKYGAIPPNFLAWSSQEVRKVVQIRRRVQRISAN